MPTQSQDPYDPVEMESLRILIKYADDKGEDERRQLLMQLGFAHPGDELRNRSYFLQRFPHTTIGQQLRKFCFPVLSSMGVFVSSVTAAVIGFDYAYLFDPKTSVSPIIVGASLGAFILTMVAFFVGYRNWELAEKNRNVDDATRRKELANKMLVDHATVLGLYVENAFDGETRYTESLLEDDELVKVKMYIYTEIDNLEFVYDKSRSGLIQTEYVWRAIKIFLARSENYSFEREARKLLERGRYNTEFVESAQVLLNVGNWVRNRTSSLPSEPALQSQLQHE